MDGFSQDSLWEAVDKEWIDSLRNESVENLLQIPSGVVQVLIHFPPPSQLKSAFPLIFMYYSYAHTFFFYLINQKDVKVMNMDYI